MYMFNLMKTLNNHFNIVEISCKIIIALYNQLCVNCISTVKLFDVIRSQQIKLNFYNFVVCFFII